MPVSIEPSTNWEKIRQIVAHPSVYRFIADDLSPGPEEWKPMWPEAAIALLMKDGDEIFGCYILYPENGVCLKVHTCVLPSGYGARASEAGRLGPLWIWEHTKCQRIITDVPEFNRLALRFAKQSGMTEFGRNPKSYLKDGKLCDVILLGVSKPDDLLKPAAISSLEQKPLHI